MAAYKFVIFCEILSIQILYVIVLSLYRYIMFHTTSLKPKKKAPNVSTRSTKYFNV